MFLYSSTAVKRNLMMSAKQGSATVGDCLQIVSNILADNDMTQKLFLHSGCRESGEHIAPGT